MNITQKQIDVIKQKVLFAAGCLRVVAQVSDAKCRADRLKEAEDALWDIQEIAEAAETAKR
jgi:hypothetical protein